MNLFSQIPSNFFSILSGSLKEVHIQLLNLVYVNYKKTINLIEKEVVIDLFMEYLEVNDEEEEYENHSEFIRDKRERAHYYLHKFCQHGWLRQEQFVDYKYRISLPDYAVKILDTFEKISSGYQLEFTGKIMSIYSNLTGEDNESFYSVQQAFENTTELIGGLKELNHNIKQYTEKLLQQENAKDILMQIFNDYNEQVLGKHYYRLKTSENIAKYRSKIIMKTREYRHNLENIRVQAELMVEQGFVKNIIEGENTLYEWLEAIENIFVNISDILTEIDDKNRKYHRAAFAQVNYHLNKSGHFTAIINKILKQISLIYKDEYAFENTQLEDSISAYLEIYSQSYIDDTSVKLKSKRKQPIKQNLTESRPVDPNVINKKVIEYKNNLKNEISIQKINRYVEKVLKDEIKKKMDKFPFDNRKDYTNIIYTVLFSTNKKATYELDFNFEEESFIELENGVVPNVEVRMRRKK